MLITFIRTILLYFLIIAVLRLMGKKQLGELQPSELVTTILISNIATMAIEDESLSMIAGVVPILCIVCLDVLMSFLTLKSERVRKLVTGRPRIIIQDGNIDQNEMKNLRYNIDDVMEAMHDADIYDISEVQFAIVETNGKVNFLEKKEPAPPVQNSQNPPSVIIKDGVLNNTGLSQSKLGEKWLKQILFDNNVTPKKVFLLTANEQGKYYLAKKQG